MAHFVLTPAYGRDYKSASQAQSDFYDQKDFEHASSLFTGGGGRYINANDIPEGSRVQIRYARLRKVTAFEVDRRARS